MADVRTPVEYEEIHALGAINVPLDRFDPERVMSNRIGPHEQPVYLICKSGNRATKACQKLADAGYQNILQVEGGTESGQRAGLPVVEGKKSISLERQVRIAAGTIVLIGAMLALVVHPYFAAIALLVGAGLLFAGSH